MHSANRFSKNLKWDIGALINTQECAEHIVNDGDLICFSEITIWIVRTAAERVSG